MSNPDEHLVDILEPPTYMPSGKSQGIVEAIRSGAWLHVTNLWIFRTEPSMQVLFQQRENQSPIYPGLLDCSAGGHLEAGEDPLVGALRELDEELGLALDPDAAINLGRHFNASLDHSGRERRRVINKFAAKWEGELSELRVNEAEVPAVYWVDATRFLDIEKEGSMTIEGILADGSLSTREVTHKDFVYNVDDYHFRVIEHLNYLHQQGKL